MLIRLNVGGRIFCTSEATLTKIRDSYFEVLLRGNWQPDADGAYFLDLDPTYFEHILNHLRCDAPLLSGLAPHEIVHVSRQLEFLQLPLPVPLDRMWAPTDANMKLVHTNYCQTVAVTMKSVQRSVLALVPSDRFAVRIDVMVCSLAIGFTSKDAFDATQPVYANAAVIPCSNYASPANYYPATKKEKTLGLYDMTGNSGKSIVVVAQCDRQVGTIFFEVDGKTMLTVTIAVDTPSNVDMFPFVSFYATPFPDVDTAVTHAAYTDAYLGQVTLVPEP